jgi:Aspartyl protease/PDZ domain
LRITLSFLCLMLVAATACARQVSTTGNLSFDAGKSSFTLPFEIVDNRIFVGVMLEGKGPFRFILDTGAGSAVSVETARAIGAKLGREVEGRGAGETVVKAWETSVAETRLGGLVVKDQDYRVFDFSDMRHVFGSQGFDGIIGQPVFSQAVVRVDYERRLLTFTDASKFSYKGAGAEVPFEVAGYVPIIRGEVDGAHARLGLDTGDRSAFTLKGPFVERQRLRERYAPKVEAVTGFGVGGPIRAQVVRLRSLKFGPFEFEGAVTRFSLQKSGAFAASDTAGNMGGAILRQFTVIFDYTRRRLYFEKNDAYGQRLTYDRAGLWLSGAADGRSFEVFDVVAGGPAAEAGVRAGDRVVAVDGRGVESLRLIAARDELKDARRKTVRLTLSDGARLREVVIKLRDLV